MLAQSDNPLADARALLAHILRVDASYLIAHPEKGLTHSQLDAYFDAVARAERHEPLPYIVGSAPFRYLNLRVTPAVLIPRPETEQLVDKVIGWVGRRRRLTLVDVGTGSGCIGISLATELPDTNVFATDVSAEALTIARDNARQHDATITFLQGSLLEPLEQRVDAIVANLPYITDAEMETLQPSVKQFEPSLALRGGANGLDLVRDLLEQAQTKLNSGGAIFLEIGYRQGPAAVALAQSIIPTAIVRCQRDFADHDRFVIVEI